MNYLIALNNQLLRDYSMEDTTDFCGKVVAIMLYSGIKADECERFVTAITTSAILCRVHGEQLREIRELCPLTWDLIQTSVTSIAEGISFRILFNRVSQY